MKISDLGSDNDKDKLSPKDRVPMIEDLFNLVLNRKPSSRELSYYKYGSQSREEIIDKLLEDEEHKKALEDFKKLPDVERNIKKLENQVKKLNQKIEDTKEESIQLKNLLNEKNKEIAILRRENKDPYNFTHSEALIYIKGLTENDKGELNYQDSTEDTHFNTLNNKGGQTNSSLIDKIYRIIKN